MSIPLEQKINKWRSDYQDYAANNLSIINKNAETVPFIFNRMQRKVWNDIILPSLVEGKPIRILCIKDRQIGFTTFIAGYFFWISTLFANRNCLIASHDIDSAAGIFSKVKLFYKLDPSELKPLRKISNRRELYFANPDDDGELGLESRIVIDTADSKELGVSYTIQCALLSELAIWESMGLDIKQRLVALNQAIPKRAGTAIIIETTPRGEGKVSEMYVDDENGYIKIFISSVADDDYRIELNPQDYFELVTYEEHKYGNEEDEYSFYEKEVIYWYPEFVGNYSKIHHEVMCRLAWRRDYIDTQCDGDKTIFDREYPITIEKAFASSGSNLFNLPVLNDVKHHIKEFPPLVTRYRYARGVSVKEDDFYESGGGSLKIYRIPEQGFKYIIGGDVGQGAQGGDHSALVCRRMPDLRYVFSYNDTLSPRIFARITYKLALLYNNAFVGMEVNEKGGFATVEYLLHTFNYSNLYQREVTLEINQDKQEKYGWNTNKYTKPSMVADLDELIIENDLELLDIEEIEQLRKYVLFLGGKKNGQSGASSGKDDLAIADMICVQMAKFVYVSKPKPTFSEKWTLDWWAKQVPDYNSDQIGSTPKGPSYYID